ncbi:MAG: glycosyltransferase family 1 protein [Deltaproteobacteria bacterium]|nr:glycosyltransferase family 1 protein [Deltaproteobacteria bacterium]
MNICIYKHRPRADVTIRILEAYKEALERLGHRVFTLSHDAGEATPEEVRKLAVRFVDFNADLALCYGFSAMPKIGGGYFFRKHGIPLVLLCFENPFFGLDNELIQEIRSHPDYYHFFVWDSWYLDKLRELFKNCHPIRHAARIKDPAWDPALTPPVFEREVAFVGHIPDFVQMRRERLESRNPFNPVIDELMLMKMRSPGSDLFGLLNDFLKNPPGSGATKPRLSWTDPLLHREIIFPLYAEGLGRYRYVLLNCLHNFPLHYFGDLRWEASHVTFHPPVDYFEELPDIYRSTVVNLDIPPFQSIDSIDNRFFDAGAAGGLLLTRGSHELTSVFTEADEITYGSVEELEEKIRFYLEHHNERNQTAAALFRCVSADHTYEHRCRYLLETLFKSTGA